MKGALGGKVLILFNNIPIYDPSEIASSFDLNFISIDEIESIDIYKGSLSSLYASGAIAGVININTKKLNKDSLNKNKIYCAIVNQEIINFGLQLWKFENKYSYSLKYNSFRSSGFSYANDTIGSTGYDNDTYKFKEISVNIDYRILKFISFSSSLRYSKYKADTDTENFIDKKDYYYKKSNVLGDITLMYSKKNILISGLYRFDKTNRGYFYNPFENKHYKGIVHFGDIHIQVYQKRSPSVLVGFDCRKNYLRNNAFDTSSGNLTTIYPSTFEVGGYSNVNFTTSDTFFSVSLGGRLNKMINTRLLGVFHFNTSIKIAKWLNATFFIGTGYKYPSIFQLYVDNFGNTALSPEHSVYYKLSIEFNKNTTSFLVNGFYRKEKGIVNFEYNSSAYSNYEKLNCWGFEWQSKVLLFNKANFTTNYTFLAGREITESKKTFFDTVTYNYLIRRPKHVLNFGINYQVSRNFSAGMNGKFVSNFYDYGLATDDYRMNSFLIFNAQLIYQVNKHWKLNLIAQNISNKQFFDVRGYNSIPFLFNMGFESVF